MTDNLFVLTGGPGSGKSTLLAALSQRGFAVAPESGRSVICEQIAAGGHALPWDDRTLFADDMLARDLESHARFAGSREPVFFDRGIPDIVGYLELCGLDVPDRTWRAAKECRYAATVFIAPFWADIYTHDAERRQSEDEAARTCATMREVYAGLRYRLADLPKSDVEARVAFVLDTIR